MTPGMGGATDCLPCRNSIAPDLPVREQIIRTGHWRVAHAFNTGLAGWLVVLPTAHITALSELNDDAARMADQPEELRGPRIFAMLGLPPDACVTEVEMDRIGSELRACLTRGAR